MNTRSTTEPLVNYVRVHRQRANLSQNELAQVLGYRDYDSVAKHERFKSLPPLLIAIGYEIIFQEPVTEIFAGLRYAVEQAIEQRLETFEAQLRDKSVRGFRLKAHNRKLEWLEERKSASNSNSR